MSTTENKFAGSVLDAFHGKMPAGARTPTMDGALTGKRRDGKLHFGFKYRGIPFVVRAESHDMGTDMSTIASLGTLPYSAEDPERRATALAILDAAALDLGGQLRLTAKQRIELVENVRLDEPLTPTVLLTRTARLVLKTKPYLELLSLVVRPPIVEFEASDDASRAA